MKDNGDFSSTGLMAESAGPPLAADRKPLEVEETVFVVDPDSAVCDAVRELALLMNRRCETYASGCEFLDALNPALPGCVVLELMVPGISGLEIQDRLAAEESSLPVIFLTAHATTSIAVRAMRAGAVTFLEKPFRAHELWDAISEATQLSRRKYRLRTHRQRQERLFDTLAPKDRELLMLLAAGLSKEHIAQELGVCVRTVENRRGQLKLKLGVSSNAELVHCAVAATLPRTGLAE